MENNVLLENKLNIWVLKRLFLFLNSNIQIHQTIWLSTLLTIGVTYYGLDISWIEIFVTFFCVIFFDAMLIRYEIWKWIFPRAWVNAWFWISFFLRSDDILIYFFAALIAILWKRFLRVNVKNANPYQWATKGRHFLNPSNSAVFITLVLFPYLAWSNPLQWWQSVESYYSLLILFLIISTWFYVQRRLKKVINFPVLDVVIPVFLTHVFLFTTITHETWYWARLFFTGGFFIFLFFQITDPKTIPETKLSRILYWICIGILYYILWYFINENYSLLASLFFMTLFLPLIWKKEDIKINAKYTKSDLFLLTLIFSMLIFLWTLLYFYWQPDLVFNNRCNQLFCRNFNFF